MNDEVTDTDLLNHIEEKKRDVHFIPYGLGDNPDLDMWLVGESSASTLRGAIILDMPSEN